MTSESSDTRMVTALVRLRQSLTEVALPLELPGAAELRTRKGEVLAQLEDYVIPRMMTIDAPLLAVVGGSTGAGKSTLVNSLVGEKVTTPGLLRPTTRSPVLVHNPADGHWFGQDRLLPRLARTDQPTNDHSALQLVASDKVPAGLAILDAPDVDSVEEENRLLAAELLASADLWIFVTSAARYADQVPWEFLKQASERSTAVAVVLDRTPPDAVQTVATHLARMLASRGLKDSPLFIVHEGEPSPEGLLPAGHVAEIRGWLDMLADDAGARRSVVQQTLDGTVRTLTRRVYPVADGSAAQGDAVATLRTGVSSSYDDVVDSVLAAATDGTLLRGEVLARWQEFVGTGELIRSLESRVGGLREKLVGAIKGKPQQAERVQVAVASALELLVLQHAESAAERTAGRWAAEPGGRELVTGDLGRASRDLRRRAERAVREWQSEVVDLVQAEGGEKSARFLAYGAEGLAVALMIAVFSSAAGEAAGQAALARRLLDAVFDEGVVRGLVERASDSLTERVRELFGTERARFDTLLDGLGVVPEVPDKVRQAARRVDDARFAAQLDD